MITEDCVSFETAKLLKEKGFDVFGDGSYDSGIEIYKEYSTSGLLNSCATSKPHHQGYPAPTLQMAMKWLRKVYKLQINPRYEEIEDEKEHLHYVWFFDILSMNPYKTLVEPVQGYPTYEKACEEAIKYCLENLI